MRTRSRRTQPEDDGMSTKFRKQCGQPRSIEADELIGGILGLAAPLILPLVVLAIVLMAGLSLDQSGGSLKTRGGPSYQSIMGSEGRSAR